MTYSQTTVANFSAPSRVIKIDLSSTDYSPGEDFVVLVDDVTSGTAVKADTSAGNTITITKAVAGSRLGGETGIICSKIYKTGTTANSLFALY